MRLLGTAASAKRGAASRDQTAGLRRRFAVALRMTRARLPLGVALAMAFGLMLLLALGSVLGLAFYAGTANTRQLLADRTNLLLDTLEDKVEQLLRPVEAELRIIGGEIAVGEIEPEHFEARRRTLAGILSATPQIVGVVFVTPELQAYRFIRDQGAKPVEDWSNLQSVKELIQRGKGAALAWGPPAWSDELRKTVINAHLPIEKDGRLLGVLFAAVTLDTVVQHVDEVSAGIGQPVFVLQGRDMVVALPGLDTALAGPGHPLPLLAAAGNPVLAAMWAGSDDPLDVLSDGLRGDVRLVKAADENWIVLSRDIVGFGDQPWVVGTYLPQSIAGAEISRLRLALVLSVACLLLAMAATFWLGRRMARPVVKLPRRPSISRPWTSSMCPCCRAAASSSWTKRRARSMPWATACAGSRPTFHAAWSASS